MIVQDVHARETKPLAGVLLIAAMLLGLLVASFLGSLLNLLFKTTWCSAIVWLLTVGLAIWVMRERVMEYRYTVANDRVYVERVFGAHYAKMLLNAPLMDVLETGAPDEIVARHPEIKFRRRAYLKACPLPIRAYVYRKDGVLEILLAQPNEEMQKALFDPEKRKASAKEKWG